MHRTDRKCNRRRQRVTGLGISHVLSVLRCTGLVLSDSDFTECNCCGLNVKFPHGTISHVITWSSDDDAVLEG